MGKRRPDETDEERVARKARKKSKKKPEEEIITEKFLQEEKNDNSRSNNDEEKDQKKMKKKRKKEKKKKKSKTQANNDDDDNGVTNIDQKPVAATITTRSITLVDTADDEKKKEKNSDAVAADSSTTTDEENATTTALSWNTFDETIFGSGIRRALVDAGFEKPSPIQARAWPAAMLNGGKDIIAVAKTGSGKTLGFLLPIFHRIATQDYPNSNDDNSYGGGAAPLGLVVSPTRELAIQIHKECLKFGGDIGRNRISSMCVYGGTKVYEQIQELRKTVPHVVIATPGRLCDLLERSSSSSSSILTLKRCHFIVLDEADRMLDMGFERQLNQIMEALPETKDSIQTYFFTATWPKSVRKVASKFMRNKDMVEEIFLDRGNGTDDDDDGLVANKAVQQTFIEAQDDMKDRKLYDLLCSFDEHTASVVIFANTKRRVDMVAKLFWQEGFTTCAVHGDKKQEERDAALHKFVTKQCSILVATDVAARGLDIKGVTHVINFDMARDCDSYIHRIGRTGRAGEVGEAITFWNPDYDIPCSPALVKIAKDAGQVVPEFLKKYEKGKSSKQWKVTDAAKAKSVLTTCS